MKRSRKTLFALLLALVMTLGLTATAWATEGDETVGGDGTVVGPVDPGTGNYPTPTELKIPFIKKVTLGGNTDPGETEFKLEIFDIGNSNVHCEDVSYTAAVTTNVAGSYKGTLIISGTAEQIRNIVSEGFFVREVNDKRSGWTYSDAVWFVTPECQVQSGVPPMEIYPAEMKKGDDGEFHFRKVEGADTVGEMTFENVYTYNHTTQAQRPAEKPNTPETTVSPKTFDAGVALYGVSALLSLTGTALIIKRKNG